MFETGMSALVLKICSEYAKALGLNFPPCVQQEINAIAQYVDLHTVKDLRVEQNGSVATITCYTEGEQEKVFTVTLPEVNVDVLFNLIKGSSSVVVNKSEDGTHLVVRLEQSVFNDINSKLSKPANPTADSAVTMSADGTVGTKQLNEIGGVQFIEVYDGRPITEEKLAALKANKANQIIYYGGSKYYFKLAYEKSNNEWVYATFIDSAATLTINMTTCSATFHSVGSKSYMHNIRLNAQFTYNDNASGDFLFSFTSSRQTVYKLQDLTTIFNAFGSNIITTATIRKNESEQMPYYGIANILYSEGADVLEIRAFIESGDTVTGYYKTGSLGNITSLQDTVTEL